MRKIIIENVDMMSEDEERNLIETLGDLNVEFKEVEDDGKRHQR